MRNFFLYFLSTFGHALDEINERKMNMDSDEMRVGNKRTTEKFKVYLLKVNIKKETHKPILLAYALVASLF